MGKIMIELPTHETIKEGEIEILEKLAEKLDTTQSYLSSLFSQALVKWVREMVRNDYAPDIYKAYGTALKERNEKMQKIADMERNFDNIAKAVTDEKEVNKTLIDELDNKQRAISMLEQQIEQNQRDFNRLMVERDECKHKAYVANVSVMELKAKLFDYIVAETEDVED